MADDTVASLGFAVDSKPLDDAKAKLKDVSTQAKETGQAVDDFNQKASKVGTNLGAGPKQLAAGLSEAEQAAAKAGTSLNVLESMAKRSGVSIGEMATRVAAARVGMSATAVASAELGTALNVVAPAANAAAVSVATKSAALTDLNRALRTASPLLNEFSGGLGHVLSGATRARGSIAVLAAVVGGELAIGIGKAADQVARGEKLFAALTGSATSGATALAKVRETASASNADFGSMATALQKIAQGQSDFANKSIIYANSADMAAKKTLENASALGTLNKIMETAKATAKEENEIRSAVSDSIQKTGNLTADAFQKIINISLPTAEAIANAFGRKDVFEFQRLLEKTPITADELIAKLREIAPLADEAFKKRDITIEQQIRGVIKAWDDLEKSIGQVGGFTLAKNALDVISGALKQDATDIQGLATAISSLGAMAGSALSSIQSGIGSVAGALSQSGGGTRDSSGDIQAPPDTMFGFASGGSFKVGGSGGTDSQTVTFKATPDEIVTISTPDQAASGIASLTAVSGTTDIEDLLKDQTKAIVDAINGLKTPSAVASTAVAAVAAVGGGGVPAFGAGGSAVGGGAGGNNPFKKLEDELKKHDAELAARERELGGGGNFAGGSSGVSGLTRGQGAGVRGYNSNSFPASSPVGQYAAASGVSMNPDSRGLSQDALDALPGTMSKDFGWIGTQQAYQSVLDDSLVQLKRDFDSQKAFNETIASQNGGLQTLKPGQVSSSYPPGVLGRYDDNMNFIPAKPNNNMGFFPNNNDFQFAGKTNPFPYQPGISTPLSFPSYNDRLMNSLRPMGGVDETGFKDAFGKPIKDVEKNTNETNRNLNEANQSLDDVGRATASTTRGVESGARDTVEAIGASSNTIANAISSALSSMGQSLMDQGGGSSGGLGGGGSSGGGSSSDYTGGAGFLDSFGLPSGGGFGGSSGGSNSGFGGSGGGTGNPFGDLYDPSTGGFDASNFVESSGDFARGGSFVAGGDGGTDTTPIKFFATKGERVTITPPGMRVSPAMLNPGSSGAAPSRTVQHVTNKKVTINVQAGISADTILRSRAQIQRSM